MGSVRFWPDVSGAETEDAPADTLTGVAAGAFRVTNSQLPAVGVADSTPEASPVSVL